MYTKPMLIFRYYQKSIIVFPLTALLIFFSSISNGVDKSPSIKNIDIILSANKIQYYDIANSIKKNVQKDRYDLRIFQIGGIDKLLTKQRRSGLIITIGVDAASEVMQRQPTVPVISVYIPRFAYQTLRSEKPVYSRQYYVGAVFIDQPLRRQLRLLRVLMPNAVKIGMILGPISSQILVKRQSFLLKSTFQVTTLKVTSDDIDVKGLEQLMQVNDAILSLPDPTVQQPLNAKKILYYAYRAKKPIIAFSKAYVNAGALGSIYSSPEQIGLQAAEKIDNYFYITNVKRKKFEDPKYFEVSINPSVAWTLDISAPEPELIRRAIVLLEKEDE